MLVAACSTSAYCPSGNNGRHMAISSSDGSSTIARRCAGISRNEAKETGVPLSNLMSYIAVNYVREEKKKTIYEINFIIKF